MRSQTAWLKCLFPFVALPVLLGCQNTVSGLESDELKALIQEGAADAQTLPVLLILPGEAEIEVGDFLQLSRGWEDAGVAYDDPSKILQWTSENPAIASVTPDGLVHGLAEGTVRVTATNEEGSAEALLRVKSR